jgi:hypothetical protein
VRIASMMNLVSPRKPWFTSLRFPYAAVNHSAQGPDEECDIVGKLF